MNGKFLSEIRQEGKKRLSILFSTARVSYTMK